MQRIFMLQIKRTARRKGFLLLFYRKRFMTRFQNTSVASRSEQQGAFLTSNSEDFKLICELAGRNSNYVKEKNSN